MGEAGGFYRMNTLMGYSDIDAFAAQKNAGSRPEYFALLDRFIETGPETARELERLAEADALEDMVLAIGDLQDELVKIGATAMMWEAEKVAVLAREGGTHEKCLDETFILTAKLKGLQERLREAKAEGPAPDPAAPPRARPAPAPGHIAPEPAGREQDRPRAEIKPEPVEKLILLIENFELDDAMAALEALRACTYGAQVDDVLERTNRQLAAFEYDGALAGLRSVLGMVQSREAGKPKSAAQVILAVDDVPDVLNTVKAVLGERYTVYGVTNHKAALRFLASKHADLILLDIEMPYMDGFAMLGIIRRIKAYAHTPVLFLTGSASEENVKRSHTMGANDFIGKPVDAKVLTAKVEKHLPGPPG